MTDKSKIDYAVYLESDSIIACDRQNHHHSFPTSSASERLNRCVIYLDEVHTRGADFKFPTGFKAAPQTWSEENAFEKGWIDIDGFVREIQHRHNLQLDRCRFTSSPLHFVKQLLENKNNSHAPLMS
ncbi:unnamed protein product, partial [Rotaria sp. Silwood2]